MTTMVIYHGNCPDGFGSAWAFREAHKQVPTKEVEYFPGTYQDPPPAVDGKDVVLLDFCYKAPELLAIAEAAESVLVIDHHKTAFDEVVGVDEILRQDESSNFRYVFSMNHSGAILTWNHYKPGVAPPEFLEYIEDADLYRWNLQSSRDINAFIRSKPYSWELWDEMVENWDFERARQQGIGIINKHNKDVAELVNLCARPMKIGKYIVPGASIPHTMTSDAAHYMARESAFAVCYWDTQDGRVFSLRSHEHGVDVSEVAKEYGGGGHKHAAGFRVPLDRIEEFEL